MRMVKCKWHAPACDCSLLRVHASLTWPYHAPANALYIPQSCVNYTGLVSPGLLDRESHPVNHQNSVCRIFL